MTNIRYGGNGGTASDIECKYYYTRKKQGSSVQLWTSGNHHKKKWSMELKISLQRIMSPACDKYAKNNINHNVHHTPLKYFINKSAGVR